jgi:hypothetical protein
MENLSLKGYTRHVKMIQGKLKERETSELPLQPASGHGLAGLAIYYNGKIYYVHTDRMNE